MPTTIEAVTVEGVVYLSASDVIAALRGRADEIDVLTAAMGDDLTAEQYETAVAYSSAAGELRNRADWWDIAVIEYLSRAADATG